MDISGSGALGVCSSDDGRLWVWDADTGETRVGPPSYHVASKPPRLCYSSNKNNEQKQQTKQGIAAR